MDDTSFERPALFRKRNDDLTMTWCFYREHNRCMPHFHQCVEVVYVMRGEMQALIDSRTLTISAGQMVFVPSNAIHAFTTPDFSAVIVAVMPIDFVAPMTKQLQKRSIPDYLVPSPVAEAVEIIRLLLRVSQDRANAEVIRGLSVALLGTLLDGHGTDCQLVIEPKSPIHCLMAFMQKSFTRDLNVRMVAEQLHYSGSYLSHLMKSQMNTTFQEYLSLLRCRHAATMLATEAKSVADIALASGFQSVSSFYRCFRQVYHMSPLQYAAHIRDESSESR